MVSNNRISIGALQTDLVPFRVKFSNVDNIELRLGMYPVLEDVSPPFQERFQCQNNGKICFLDGHFLYLSFDTKGNPPPSLSPPLKTQIPQTLYLSPLESGHFLHIYVNVFYGSGRNLVPFSFAPQLLWGC